MGSKSSKGDESHSDPPSQTPSTFDVASMAQKDKAYVATTDEYLSRRKLYRGARSIHIWALGVGAVISGDYFGWNLGYNFGGLGTYMMSLIVISLMFIGVCLILSELSTAIPFAGGAYAFSRATLGKFAGCFSGAIESFEYLATVGSIVWFLSEELCKILGVSTNLTPLGSVILYGIIMAFHCLGGVIMWNFMLLITMLSVLWLLVFFFGTIKDWEGGDRLNVIKDDDDTRWFPDGVQGFFAALAPAVWFYLGIEEVPLAAEECQKSKKNIWRGMLSGILTLVILAWMTITSVAFAPGGVHRAKKTGLPLSSGWKHLLGGHLSPEMQALCSLLPLFTSAYCIAFAYGRQIFAMSRAGYFPEFLSLTIPGRGTPAAALLFGSVLTIIAQVCIRYAVPDLINPADLLFSAAVICALVSYFMTSVAYVIFRYFYASQVDRPFKAPLGYYWAGFVAISSLLALICSFVFVYPNFLYGLLFCGVAVAIVMVYYLVWSRTRLKISPEEQFAMFCLYRYQVQNETLKRSTTPKEPTRFERFLGLFS